MNTSSPAQIATERVRNFYAAITVERLGGIEEVYAPDAYFRDPFNEVRGVLAIRGILARMLDHLDDCRFTFRDQIVGDDEAFLSWDFAFRVRRWRPETRRSFRGATHVRFESTGLVIYHHDYWDAGEAVYEKVPVLGALVRRVKRRLK